MSDAPERLWRQYPSSLDGLDFEVTEEKYDNDGETEYVRADLYEAALQRAEAAEAECAKLKRIAFLFAGRDSDAAMQADGDGEET